MPAIKFRGVDFLEFDSLLNEDEILVRNTARQFIEDNLIPIIEECNRKSRFPRELIRPMAELGFYGRDMKFVVEPGEFKVFVSNSSVGGREASFEVAAK